MYNMEIYCTRPYCIEKPFWTRRLWRLVQYRFSIQYWLVLDISEISLLHVSKKKQRQGRSTQTQQYKLQANLKK